ncbi:NAD(P)/FAD-dependent oxidoreductase [Oculatella sp. LEGE 06141]|uniref:FAD-dependent oxidoreductase n=1 Tax=Oculatella sp. LEGE 06141 TaxID=1828648 RepID=UPI0018820A8D|nr:NAD(P)/FAD-dependent oxidoreductase [Oculatella sp. LEGE 06141]
MERHPVAIIGAGPAGLTAAYELVKQNVKSIVLEQSAQVGGISRTEMYKGYRFDIGGHRFFTKIGEVEQFWREILGDTFIKVPRLSRIYYQGKFYNYPLSLFNALTNLGPITSFFILGSYLKAKLRKKINPDVQPTTFEEWVTERFGGRLYKIFFKTYTEKVWGLPCNKIRADWAAQRIKGMSLKRAVLNAAFGSQTSKSLIKEFDYPALGPGMMWERCQELVESRGASVQLNTSVISVHREGMRIKQITAAQGDRTIEIEADHFISTMPITALMHRLDPPPPAAVIEAAHGLKYRDFLIVSLIIDRAKLFPDNWIYIHSPEFKVGRIQNFKNWSAAMVPDPSKSCLGMEYFCSEGDSLWEMSDDALIALATREVIELNLGVKEGDVDDGVVIRQYKAYPVYDGEYRQNLQVIQDYLSSFENLQTVGRNGMHRYNNQDHSMLTAMLAVKNILGEDHDVWNVNTERSYHEEVTIKEQAKREAAQKEPLSSVSGL